MSNEKELPIIQKPYDLILWYVPLLDKLPRDHKFALGDRNNNDFRVVVFARTQ